MDDILIEFKDKFVNDALELVKNLEKSLMQLENNSTDKEAIEEVFRFAHTLKGVSGMYGYDKIAEYTHKLETLFDCIRNETLIVNTEIIDLTLQSADHIKNLLLDFDFTKSENQNKQALLLEKLIFYINNDNKEQKTITSTIKTHKKKLRSYYIYFVPAEDLLFRGIKIINIFRELAEIGTFEIFEHQHSVTNEKETDNTTAWGIFLTTEKEKETIEDVFMFIEDNYKLYKLSDDDLFTKKQETETSTPEIKNLSLSIEKLQNLQQSEIKDIIDQNIEKTEQNNKPKSTKKIVSNNAIYNNNISQTINVDTEKLDTLMYLVTELVTNNAQLKRGFQNADMQQLKTVVENMEKITKQFRDNTFSLRLIPINKNILYFQRLIRDLSNQLNKQIKFEIKGGDTELDKNILDKLTEPLMHIIRNSIDHGIETPTERIKQNKAESGTIKFTAKQEGNLISITVSDDGKGIDPEIIRNKAIEKNFITSDTKLSAKEIYTLIFKPGLSTAESLTQVSGRGVGMDIVKRKLTELGAQIEIDSKIGIGTSFKIKLQQTIAILDTMLFQNDDMYLLVPLSDIEECGLISINILESKKHTGTVPYNNELIPYIDLYELYNLKKPVNDKLKLIIINKQGSRFAITSDIIIGEHQAVLKSMGKHIKKQENIAGASILADGNLAFLLDTIALANLKLGI